MKKLPDGYEEMMSLEDYLFRYDQGAFWMGAYLFQLPLLARFILQGIFKLSRKEGFTQKEVESFHRVHYPKTFWRALSIL